MIVLKQSCLGEIFPLISLPPPPPPAHRTPEYEAGPSPWYNNNEAGSGSELNSSYPHRIHMNIIRARPSGLSACNIDKLVSWGRSYMRLPYVTYLQTEDQGNDSKNKEAAEYVDDGENQVVVWLDPRLYLSNSSWLLSNNHLQKVERFVLITPIPNVRV